MYTKLLSVLALTTSMLFTGVGAMAQTNSTTETRILIGLAGATPNDRVQGIDISTSEIDRILAGLTLPSDIPVPSNFPTSFGDHFTRNLANEAFADYDQVKHDLQNKLRVALLNVDIVQQVYSIQVDPNPLTLRIYQTETNLGAKLGSFEASVHAKVKYLWLGFISLNADVVIEIRDISLEGEYDAFHGTFENITGRYKLGRVQASGNNVITSIGLAFYNVRSALNNEIKDALADMKTEIESTELFSVEKFLISAEGFVRAFDPGMINTNIPLPQIPSNDLNDAADAIAELRAFIDGYPGFSVQLNMEIKEGGVNEVSVIASHIATDIIDFEYYTQCAPMTLAIPPRTEKVDVYSRSSSYGPWVKVGTTYGVFNSEVWLNDVEVGAQFVAIGKNNLIGNLYGVPESTEVYTYTNELGGPQPIADTIGECGDGDGGIGFPNLPW